MPETHEVDVTLKVKVVSDARERWDCRTSRQPISQKGRPSINYEYVGCRDKRITYQHGNIPFGCLEPEKCSRLLLGALFGRLFEPLKQVSALAFVRGANGHIP